MHSHSSATPSEKKTDESPKNIFWHLEQSRQLLEEKAIPAKRDRKFLFLFGGLGIVCCSILLALSGGLLLFPPEHSHREPDVSTGLPLFISGLTLSPSFFLLYLFLKRKNRGLHPEDFAPLTKEEKATLDNHMLAVKEDLPKLDANVYIDIKDDSNPCKYAGKAFQQVLQIQSSVIEKKNDIISHRNNVYGKLFQLGIFSYEKSARREKINEMTGNCLLELIIDYAYPKFF